MTAVLDITELELTAATLNDASVEDIFLTVETLILQLNQRMEKIVNNINTCNASLQEQITDVENSSNESGDSLISRIEVLEANVAALQITVSSLQVQITNLDARITVNEGDIDQLKLDLADLELRVTNLENDLAALTVRVSQNETDILALQEADCVVDKTIDSFAVNVVISDNTNTTFLMDATAGDITISLPALIIAYDPTGKKGWIFNIVKIDSTSNKVTITGSINGITNFDLVAQDEVINVQAFSGTWRVVY